ncbi:hypothetical protein [Streptomyces sp. NBC_00620]|uniref:hypothetical protein n=1 Tax=Streptomyces sp. NBC_00620 TaxID=2903666 RepID=UPI00225523F3|nr:hypothetical protein [Streptomyces sp. NBC_00620]MCX4972992.1 hypothetical protein [Streptomyces sp. NBC_00620]
MTGVLPALLLTTYIVGFLLCIGVAVDVITRHPYDWMRTGSSQKFRIFLIFAPLVTIIFPIGLATGIFYLRKVRPLLTLNARVVVSKGWPAVPRRPIMGLNWAWHGLRTSRKVKAILSVGGAFFLDSLIVYAPHTQESTSRWSTYAALVFLWPIFFFASYLALGFAQILLHLNMGVPFFNSNESLASNQMQVLEQKEYDRRASEFHKRQFPQAGWNQKPW